MAEIFDTLLLLALPASGKSETRNYLTHRDPESFHMGPTLQLDDFPYVHLQKRIDQELEKLGQARVFHADDDAPFIDKVEFGALVRMVNEDYHHVLTGQKVEADAPGALLIERLERARVAAGGEEKLKKLPSSVLAKLAMAIDDEAAAQLVELNKEIPESREGKTIVIEFSRGGPEGSEMPLPYPYGYQFSLAQLSEEILTRSVALYIWVTPEESRRKNVARADPDDPGSILHHGTPHAVMMEEYGCDDMHWLIEQSKRPGHIQIDAHGKTFDLPLAVFDNRDDKTSFLRNDPSSWSDEDIAAIHGPVAEAAGQLWETWKGGK